MKNSIKSQILKLNKMIETMKEDSNGFKLVNIQPYLQILVYLYLIYFSLIWDIWDFLQ